MCLFILSGRLFYKKQNLFLLMKTENQGEYLLHLHGFFYEKMNETKMNLYTYSIE